MPRATVKSRAAFGLHGRLARTRLRLLLQVPARGVNLVAEFLKHDSDAADVELRDVPTSTEVVADDAHVDVARRRRRILRQSRTS
jgi:hypothetical protein